MSDVHLTHDPLSSASEASSTPSFIEQVDLKSIASLATAARKRTTSIDVTCTVNSLPKSGSYNVVWFVDFEDDIHWVFRTPRTKWNPWLKRRLRSDIITMKLIQSRTNIPIPLIHDFSVDVNNAFGRPYMILDRVEGSQLSKLWFDPKWFTEERRKNVFRSLISCMIQLRDIEFSAIGCLDYDPKTDSHVVGPLLPTVYEIWGKEENMILRGPYSTVHAYLLDGITSKASVTSGEHHKTCLSLLRLFAGGLPDQSLDGPPFVLSMPDFGYQNIFVDDEGHVTGLIDWDDASTCPRQGGFARYPSWITRDWDPMMYAYPGQREARAQDQDKESSYGEDGSDDSGNEDSPPQRNKDATEIEEDTPAVNDIDGPASQSVHIPSREELQEDSPKVLQKFRDEYLCIFEDVDPLSANYTCNSHIYEAIEIAIGSSFCRDRILERLTEYVFGYHPTWGDLTSWHLLLGIGSGHYHGDCYSNSLIGQRATQ